MAKILVIGATGKTGLPLVKKLVAAGAQVRALIRDEKKRNLLPAEAEIVIGDLDNVESLDSAMAGVEKVYLASSAFDRQSEQQIHAVEAAKRNGVKHIVKLAAMGSSPYAPVQLLVWHAQIEEAIQNSGMAYTFLHPHAFMDNLLGDALTIKSQGAIFSPLGETPIPMIWSEDIAEVACHVLTTYGHEGQTYDLTGGEALNYGQIAATFTEVLGKPVGYVPVPFEAARSGMAQAGVPKWFADDMIMLMEMWQAGEGVEIKDTVQKLTGKTPKTYAEFIAENKNKF